METEFSAEFFSGNRARLRELFTGQAPIVLTANSMVQKNADTAFPFAQDANFWYLTGINLPDIVLVLDKDKEYLVLPERSNYQDIFDGKVDGDVLAAQSGITTVLKHKDGWKQLAGRLKRAKHVAVIAPPPTFLDTYGMYTNPARAQLAAAIKHENAAIELLDIRDHMARLRSLKQPVEIRAIKAAIALTGDAIKAVTKPKKLASYHYEYEIEADMYRLFRRAGSAHAFDPIIATGAKACVLHSTELDGELRPGDLLQFDVGAAVNGYAADISRSVSISGEPSRRQLAIHAAVLEVQDYALSLLKPGTLLREYEKQVEQFMGEKLRELNLIKTIDHDEVRTYYPHAASHFLGLDVHDVGKYDRPLEPGMVLTCEPGIYVANEGIGVRIEDDVLITETGNEILSAQLPRDLQ